MSMIICIVCDYWHTKRTYIKLCKILTASETNEKNNNNFKRKIPFQILIPNKRHEFNSSTTNKENVKKNGQNMHYKNCDNKNRYKNVKTQTPNMRKYLHLPIDGISAIYLVRELEHHHAFRQHLCDNKDLQKYHILYLHVVTSVIYQIDYKWCKMLLMSLHERIDNDCLMSWLSTLGGGFSALGEQFDECAKKAGKISLKQLEVGLKLGDPFLQARCKLYYSLSLLQMGKLRAAKYLIRQQYAFARQHKEVDTRLVKMCRGIWLRLEYEYKIRLNAIGSIESSC